jgi:cold shock CspA family protein
MLANVAMCVRLIAISLQNEEWKQKERVEPQRSKPYTGAIWHVVAQAFSVQSIRSRIDFKRPSAKAVGNRILPPRSYDPTCSSARRHGRNIQCLRTMFGTITKIVLGRGFGFIRERDGERKETFFHASQLRGGLQFDERLLELEVEYDVKETFGGPKAENVRPLK